MTAPPASDALSDEQILHLWDIYVGSVSPTWPLERSDKLAFARAVLAAVSCAGWRPIESAPKSTATGDYVHGIYLLGFCPDPDTCNLESAVCVIWWEPLMKGGKGMWYGEGGYEVKPTHWQPLPAAPAASPPPAPADGVKELGASKPGEGGPPTPAGVPGTVLRQSVTAAQAREALDELEGSARGDEPFNHFAGPLLRQFIAQHIDGVPAGDGDYYSEEAADIAESKARNAGVQVPRG